MATEKIEGGDCGKIKIKLYGKQAKKEELGINKKKFEIELFRIIYSGKSGPTGRMGIVLAIRFAFQTKLTGSMRNGIKNN